MVYGEHEDKEVKPVLVAHRPWRNHEILSAGVVRSLQLPLGIFWRAEKPVGIKAMQVPTCSVGGQGSNYTSSQICIQASIPSVSWSMFSLLSSGRM